MGHTHTHPYFFPGPVYRGNWRSVSAWNGLDPICIHQYVIHQYIVHHIYHQKRDSLDSFLANWGLKNDPSPVRGFPKLQGLLPGSAFSACGKTAVVGDQVRNQLHPSKLQKEMQRTLPLTAFLTRAHQGVVSNKVSFQAVTKFHCPQKDQGMLPKPELLHAFQDSVKHHLICTGSTSKFQDLQTFLPLYRFGTCCCHRIVRNGIWENLAASHVYKLL